MGGYTIPYAPRERYDYGDSNIGRLLAQRGEIAAEAARRSGQIWGGVAQQVGGIASGALQQYGEEREKKKQAEALSKRTAALDKILAIKDPTERTNALIQWHPKDGLDIAKGLNALSPQAKYEDQMARARDAARGILALPKERREQGYAFTRSQLTQSGAFPEDQIPPQFNEDFLTQVASYGVEPPEVKTRVMERTNPDGTITREIVEDRPGYSSTSAAPPKQETRSIEVQMAEALAKGDRETYDRLVRVKRDAGRADDRERAIKFTPKMIMVDGKEVQANYDQTTGKYHDVETGAVLKGVQAAPTADMRNKERGRELAARSVDAVRSLSEKLITKRGVAQRATAAGRSVQSALGNDPEYRTYQDARRALAGNLAVAQQGSRPSDSDIESIWLPLVPDVFSDTDQSAAMKWDLIDTMGNRKRPDAGAASPKKNPFR